MIALQHSRKLRTGRWMFFVCLLLIGCFAQAVRAQDTTTDEPTTLPTAAITNAPTDVALLPDTPTQPPAAPILSLPIATLTEITFVPTDVAALSSEPTELPATPILSAPTQEATVVPTLFVSMPTPSEQTLPPTEPPQTIASITIVPSVLRLPENSVISLLVVAQGLANVANVTITCQADPAVLRGTQALPGDLLSADQAVVTDSGFQLDGQWTISATPSDSASVFSGSGVLWSLNYQGIAPGFAQIECRGELVDQNGQSLPLAVSETNLAIEVDQDASGLSTAIEAADLTSTPLSATVTGEAESVLSSTPEKTQALAPTNETTDLTSSPLTGAVTDLAPVLPDVETVTPLNPTAALSPTSVVITVMPALNTVTPLTHLSGRVEVSQPLMHAVVTIIGADGQQTVAVQADGSFAIDIPAGHYQITFSAPHYLPYILEGTLPDQPVTLSPIRLVDGDADGNGVVDEADVVLVIDNFGLAAPAEDLNGDQVVNIYDLAIVSANTHRNN